jgi:putative transcriptional regulator
MPQLLDPNFHRAVVLLIHHDEGGTFGVVLNRSTDIEAPTRIDWGGPVQPQSGWVLYGPTSLIHTTESERTLADGVKFVGALDEVLGQLETMTGNDVRFLFGYAGWGPGQLEAELVEGAWLTAPVTSEVVFHVEMDNMWETVVRSLGIDPATLSPASGIH